MIIEIIALFTILSGCSKIKQLANINADIPYSSQLNLPALAADTLSTGLPAGGLSIPLPSISFATNSQTYLNQYHTAANMILDVYLKSLTMKLAAPANQNFDFLDSVQVYLSANSQSEV